ncbi:hypothetical protein SELMODRAFT_430705 [Selaginella moellendorffii]|uniref:Uncharacterized protein n=1 Tax=Selaginella moellendorffii TaxID=88036 RepID=D8TA83_SELML|nr:hypothetical protein SELMODRAFT_430705 [Selaginella moellendorffii]
MEWLLSSFLSLPSLAVPTSTELSLRESDFTVKDGFLSLPFKFSEAEIYVRVEYKRLFHKRTGYTLAEADKGLGSLPGFTSAANFMARFFICGGIVRNFKSDLKWVVENANRAVFYYYENLAENFSTYHRVIPDHDMKHIGGVEFVSSWCLRRFNELFYESEVNKRLELVSKTIFVPRLAAAARGVFEDFAHSILRRGGNFRLADGSIIILPPATIKHHYGNNFPFTTTDMDKYVLLPSQSYPLMDALAGRFKYLLQVTCSKSRSPMWKSDYDSLVDKCRLLCGREPIFLFVTPEGNSQMPYIKLKVPMKDTNGNVLRTPNGRVSFSTEDLKHWNRIILSRCCSS